MKFVHTNIAANDWRALCNFYINVFECREKPPVRDLAGEWLDNGTGLNRASLKGLHLILPGYGDDGPTLEIFSYETMTQADPIMANHKGYTHIAFLVDDVKQTYDKAIAHGAKDLGRITRREIENIGTLVFVYLRDPEGNIIEIQSWE